MLTNTFELEPVPNDQISHVSCQLKNCVICFRKGAKYKCPNCLLWTCSLSCFTFHKEKKNCTGIKKEFGPVKLNEFNDRIFKQDVRFLENVSKIAEKASRINAKRFTTLIQNRSHGIKKRFPPVSVLHKKCQERQISFHFLPLEFSKRRQNTTQLTRKAKRLAWRVAWRFPEHYDVSYVDSSISEDSVLKTLLHRFYLPDESTDAIKSNTDNLPESSIPLLLKKSKDPLNVFPHEIIYKDTSLENYKNKDESPSSTVRWYLLNKENKLSEALSHKHVYEFPEFLVVSYEYLNNSEVIRFPGGLIKDP
ncbi:box C/D snoRNA protein 1-like [Hylaeus volcanicus]|uniref:box C/D snoRNA protein 1-like n=1 Tax=Hylaeus volcanicus TaxID=313075 RepID=UPI0023B77954|nr:box C/D snoRNA protein 1-like [Hylaeus volcanicus]